MDIGKVIAQLHEELAHLDAAILSLERLQQGARHRGRRPSWLADGKVEGKPARNTSARARKTATRLAE
jgi:hypothetical protein